MFGHALFKTHESLRHRVEMPQARPRPVSSSFDKPDEDRLMLHNAVGPKPNIFSPPIFLARAAVDIIKVNWR